MKNVIIKIFQAVLASVMFSGLLFAADPAVNGAAVSPTPITSSTGISVSFNTANNGTTTSSPAISITVSLILLKPSATFNVETDITGEGAARFTWSYDEINNIVTGELTSSWPTATGGIVTISNLVSTGTSSPGSEGNGLNVNVVAPEAVNTQTTNDNTSAYTSSSVVLPVDLTYFNVIKEADAAQLSWATAEESNSDFFEVQHSPDTKNWKGIGKVKAGGESASSRTYGFVHASPVNGSNYYRLKMVDYDGTFAYSGIKTINFQNLFTARVYPNPVANILTIETRDWAMVVSVELVSSSGISVYQSDGKPVRSIDVRNLNSGVYIVKLVKTDGTIDKLKTIVAK